MRALAIVILLVGVACAAPASSESDPAIVRSAGDALSHQPASPAPPAAWFEDVAAAPGVVAAIDQNGTMWVWGRDIERFAVLGNHESVTVGQTVACGLSEDGEAACVSLVPECEQKTYGFCDYRPRPGLSAIAAGQDFACGLRADDGTIECWGRTERFPEVEGSFVDVYAGGRAYCGRTEEGVVSCAAARGPISPSYRKTLEGRYASFSLGHGMGCGLDFDGEYRCEDLPVGYGLDRALLGDFASVEPANVEGHAIRSAPSAGLTTVTLGVGHGCGLSTTGGARCWGDDRFGQAAPPPGSFTRVVTGDDFSCGLDPDGVLTCWGGNWSCIGPDVVEGENECGACGPMPSVVGGACGCSGRVVCGGDEGGVSVPSFECQEALGTADDPILLDAISDRDEPRSYRGLLSERSEYWFTLPVEDSIFGYYAGIITLDVPDDYMAALELDTHVERQQCGGDASGLHGVHRTHCETHTGLVGPMTLTLESNPWGTLDELLTIHVRSVSDIRACVPFELRYEF
jgi:hypothetical protein